MDAGRGARKTDRFDARYDLLAAAALRISLEAEDGDNVRGGGVAQLLQLFFGPLRHEQIAESVAGFDVGGVAVAGPVVLRGLPQVVDLPSNDE